MSHHSHFQCHSIIIIRTLIQFSHSLSHSFFRLHAACTLMHVILPFFFVGFPLQLLQYQDHTHTHERLTSGKRKRQAVLLYVVTILPICFLSHRRDVATEQNQNNILTFHAVSSFFLCSSPEACDVKKHVSFLHIFWLLVHQYSFSIMKLAADLRVSEKWH